MIYVMIQLAINCLVSYFLDLMSRSWSAFVECGRPIRITGSYLSRSRADRFWNRALSIQAENLITRILAEKIRNIKLLLILNHNLNTSLQLTSVKFKKKILHDFASIAFPSSINSRLPFSAVTSKLALNFIGPCTVHCIARKLRQTALLFSHVVTPVLGWQQQFLALTAVTITNRFYRAFSAPNAS